MINFFAHLFATHLKQVRVRRQIGQEKDIHRALACYITFIVQLNTYNSYYNVEVK